MEREFSEPHLLQRVRRPGLPPLFLRQETGCSTWPRTSCSFMIWSVPRTYSFLPAASKSRAPPLGAGTGAMWPFVTATTLWLATTTGPTISICAICNRDPHPGQRQSKPAPPAPPVLPICRWSAQMDGSSRSAVSPRTYYPASWSRPRWSCLIRLARTNSLLVTGSTGNPWTTKVYQPAFSTDGSHLAFQSWDEALTEGDLNRAGDVFRW